MERDAVRGRDVKRARRRAQRRFHVIAQPIDGTTFSVSAMRRR
jgi:hypothetical protein